MSDIYKNAVDSLKVGVNFFLADDSYSSRKHAILILFHAIELFIKEHLYRINRILIYKNIDKKITEDSFTAGFSELLIRLENLKVEIPPDQIKAITKIQRLRNRIEHHRYDEKEEDKKTISESLRFILYFVEHFLGERLDGDIDSDTLREIQRLVLEYNERQGLANYRLEKWLKEKWPEWNPYEEDTPEAFEGTHDCPECRQSYLIVDGAEKPKCFFCNTSVDATRCDDCGSFYLPTRSHSC